MTFQPLVLAGTLIENSPLAPVFHAWPSLLHSLKTWVKQRPRAKKFNQFLIISEIVNLFLDKWIFCAKLLEIAVSADFLTNENPLSVLPENESMMIESVREK